VTPSRSICRNLRLPTTPGGRHQQEQDQEQEHEQEQAQEQQHQHQQAWIVLHLVLQAMVYKPCTGCQLHVEHQPALFRKDMLPLHVCCCWVPWASAAPGLVAYHTCCTGLRLLAC
jgi:hypothetical protein